MYFPPGANVEVAEKPLGAYQLLKKISKGEYEPPEHIVVGVQEIIDAVSPVVPEIILVAKKHDPHDGYYINTGVSAATAASVPKVTTLDPLTFVTSPVAAVVIDREENSFVARILYTNALLFAHKEDIAKVFQKEKLARHMTVVSRGAAHPALEPMYAYGHRVPLGSNQAGFYADSARADREWRKEVDEQILPLFHKTIVTLFESVYAENQKLTEEVGLPSLPHNQVSTMFVTIRYQSASHTDKDKSLTFGFWVKVGSGKVVGGEFLFPAHRIAVPLREGCIIIWDGNKPHCTALAEYEGATYYLASVLATPGKIWNTCKTR